jgi:Uma2 family endonuclease
MYRSSTGKVRHLPYFFRSFERTDATPTAMSRLLDQLLEAPDIRLVIARAEEALAQEARDRQDFYNWVREDQKAEFVNGEVILHSPVKRKHWQTVLNLGKLLSLYVDLNGLGEVATEKALISLTRNDYEPDVCYWSVEKTAQFEPDQMRFPAPDLVVEVLSRGTAQRDRGVKFEDYAAHGVREYWLIDPNKREIEQYERARSQAFAPVGTWTDTDALTSRVLPGFTIPVRAVFDADANLAALRTLLRT